MKICIDVSDMMRKQNEQFGVEDRLIRIPKGYLKKLKYSKDDFINMRCADGKIISLKVASAYLSDTGKQQNCAYVSPNVFSLLNIENYNSLEIIKGLTLGADPEAFLIDNANIVSAGKFFKGFGQVGADGILIEFRPLPSTEESVVVDNLYALIKSARQTINSKTFAGNNIVIRGASAYKGNTTGFHLHYGLPAQILGKDPRVELVVMQIVKVLDYYVGIPSVIPEGMDNFRRRSIHIKYGKPGSYRLDYRTLEYRVPGGSLLRHPILSKGILGLGAIVVEDVVSRFKECTDNFSNIDNIQTFDGLKELYPNLLPIVGLYRAMCAMDTSAAMDQMETITNDVSLMLGFNKRKKYCRGLF